MDWRTATNRLHHFLAEARRRSFVSFGPWVQVKAVVMTPEHEEALTFLMGGDRSDWRIGMTKEHALLQLGQLDDAIWNSETVSVDSVQVKKVHMTLDDVEAFQWLLDWARDLKGERPDAAEPAGAVLATVEARKMTVVSRDHFREHPDEVLRTALDGPVVVSDANGAVLTIERSLAPLDDGEPVS
jgi:hypothetical protein